jgi:formate hydrogenlyase subunit 4
MQRFASYLALASILSVAMLVPMGARAPLGHSADSVMLIYLLTLCGISTLLGALAAGSTYSLLGMSRESMAMMTLEPVLAVAVVFSAVQHGTLSLGGIYSGVLHLDELHLSGFVMLGVVLAAMQAFAGRLPFDISEAETELMEGPIIEYSGPKLALFKLTQMTKLFVYSALVVGLFIPWGNGWWYPAALGIFLVKVLVIMIGVGVVAAAHGRYRIDQALQYYAGLFMLSIVALGMAFSGY